MSQTTLGIDRENSQTQEGWGLLTLGWSQEKRDGFSKHSRFGSGFRKFDQLY